MAHFEKAHSLEEWLDQRLAIKTLRRVLAEEYWIPKNINFLWAMGMVLAITFGILLVSGIFLLMYYQPNINTAFDSVNYTIMREVDFGWLWRHVHGVAASVVFLIIYIHMFTGIYYGSYKKGRELIWLSGMGLFVAFSAEAFSGYMLPWGQMSYWAGMVITNLFSGGSLEAYGLVEWIRGDYVPAQAFLTRFFMLHVFLMPLLIIGGIVFHFGTLRIPHVNNQEGEDFDYAEAAELYKAGKKKESKVIPFSPVFLSKDVFVMGVYFIFFFYLVFYHFEFAMDPVNFDPADGLKTPAHIYPEWYFLWSYEVLRGFFFDIAGIAAMDIGLAAFGIANVIFFLMPWLDRSPVVAPANKRGAFNIWFWLLLIDMIVLTVYGKLPPLGANALVGFFASIVFLFLLLVALQIRLLNL